MKITTIDSPTNSLLKTIRSLSQRSGREKTGLFLIEGKKPVAEALKKNVHVKHIVVSQSYLQADAQELAAHNVEAVSVVEDRLYQSLSTTVTPEGILAVASLPRCQFEDLFKAPGTPLILVADAVQDPGNLGTMIRTALAARASGLVLTKGTVDPFNPKVVRSAMGALFALPIVVETDWADTVAELKRRNVKVVACEAKADRFYFDADLTSPVALLLGNEAHGFTESQLEMADEKIAIPMNEASESLNVAVSGAVVLFSAVQQRMQKHAPAK